MPTQQIGKTTHRYSFCSLVNLANLIITHLNRIIPLIEALEIICGVFLLRKYSHIL